MGFCEGLMSFGTPAITTSNAATVSPNVFDAGSAKMPFGASNRGRVAGTVQLSGGTNPTVRVQFVGADDAALTSNVVTLADTGVLSYKPDGSTALVNTDAVNFEISPGIQRSPKRYYGLLVTLGGTTPSATANRAEFGVSAGENMAGFRAATP